MHARFAFDMPTIYFSVRPQKKGRSKHTIGEASYQCSTQIEYIDDRVGLAFFQFIGFGLYTRRRIMGYDHQAYGCVISIYNSILALRILDWKSLFSLNDVSNIICMFGLE